MVSLRKKEIKKWPSFIGKDEGIITVYFLLAGSALILLLLALFNFGRYLTAKQQAVTALEASAASILSHYQADLVREMGLFALDAWDEDLQALGKAYFAANLGEPGAINSQKCLIYALSFPEEGRLQQEEILTIQAVDSQRIEGWFQAGQELLDFLGLSDWQSLLKLWPEEELSGQSAADIPADWGEEAGLGAEAGLEAEEVQQKEDSGGVRLWHFFLPWPISDGFADVNLPEGAGGARAAAAGESKKQLDKLTAFAERLFAPSNSKANDVAASGAILPPGALEEIKVFLADFQKNLAEVLAKGRDKLLFTEYLLQELDYATNKPAMERYFSRCEAEYVLWGYDNSWDNLRYTALQLFLLRSGLHLLKSVIDMEVVDEITLAKAALEAMLKGGSEVEKLFNGQRIAAFPGQTRLTMSYKDHLRLFLLCQRGSLQKQAVQRLIQTNLWYWQIKNPFRGGLETAGPVSAADFSLSRYATEVKVIVETKLSLWPFGVTLIRWKGVMGYDRPFTLVS